MVFSVGAGAPLRYIVTFLSFSWLCSTPQHSVLWSLRVNIEYKVLQYSPPLAGVQHLARCQISIEPQEEVLGPLRDTLREMWACTAKVSLETLSWPSTQLQNLKLAHPGIASETRATGMLVKETVFLAILFSLVESHAHFLARLESCFLLWGKQYQLIQMM